MEDSLPTICVHFPFTLSNSYRKVAKHSSDPFLVLASGGRMPDPGQVAWAPSFPAALLGAAFRGAGPRTAPSTDMALSFGRKPLQGRVTSVPVRSISGALHPGMEVQEGATLGEVPQEDTGRSSLG